MSLPPSPPLPAPVQTLLWIRRPTEFLRWCDRRYGRAFTIKLPPFRLAMISDPEAIRTIVLGTILASCDLELEQKRPARTRRRAITFWPEGGTRVRLLRMHAARTRADAA